MNIKDLVIPVGLALATAWAIHFFLDKYRGVSNSDSSVEQSFIAPEVKQKYKPLYFDVDFIDTKRSKRAIISDIETTWGRVSFSSDGASLVSIDFKQPTMDKKEMIRTIFPATEAERENRCFLVALQEKTPYYYQLVDRKNGNETIKLVYEVKFNGHTLRKTFIVHNEEHKIDLMVDILPKEGTKTALEPRIFYPSPIMPAVVQTDVISGIIVDNSGYFKKTSRDRLDMQRGWFVPTLFGAENRYFAHALVKDSCNFVQRSYYKLEGREKIISILEGPAVLSTTSWQLSFYFGPKEYDAVVAVDERLEKILDYSGFLAPISKLLLRILKWLYNYLHNYGLAIIALTGIIKLILLPFTMRSEQYRKQQQNMQKKMAYLQQKYKKDPEHLARERAELLRKHGMPELSGCLLPLLLQAPIFFALSRVLASSIELYRAPMLWISDLSARDPYYIFPILIGSSLLVQAMQGDAQQRTSGLAMALIFGAFTANLSSGLALYICTSTLLAVMQTRAMKYIKQAR